jgi:ASC-1-like (ASCH) protein
MDALFKIPASEFDEKLFEKIKSLLAAGDRLEVTISIRNRKSKSTFKKETREEYIERILTAKNNLDNGINAVSFTPDALKKFEKELLGEL